MTLAQNQPHATDRSEKETILELKQIYENIFRLKQASSEESRCSQSC